MCTLKQAIKTACSVAIRDNYNQLVYNDFDGLYTICRDYPGRKFSFGEEIIGKVICFYKEGILTVKYVEG